MSMKYPIVVLEGKDVMMLESPASLNSLEAIDVRAGVYEALDSEGYPLDLGVDAAGRVVATDRVDGVPEPERLAAILRRHVALLTENPRLSFTLESVDSASLTELIEALRPYAEESWPETRKQLRRAMARRTGGLRPKVGEH